MIQRSDKNCVISRFDDITEKEETSGNSCPEAHWLYLGASANFESIFASNYCSSVGKLRDPDRKPAQISFFRILSFQSFERNFLSGKRNKLLFQSSYFKFKR